MYSDVTYVNRVRNTSFIDTLLDDFMLTVKRPMFIEVEITVRLEISNILEGTVVEKWL